MNRDEAIKNKRLDAKWLINKIYDDFESKKCNSCKYSPNEETNTYSIECCGCSNFFSNKWEAKDA